MEVRFLFKSTSGKPRLHSKRLPVVIGRSDAADVKLRIPTDSVSRRHCEFFLDESGTVCLRDLGSTNGTLLNGKLLEPKVAMPVTPKSAVKLGTVSFRVDFQAVDGQLDHDSDTIPIEAAEPPPAATAATEPLPPQSAADLEAEPLEPATEEFAPAVAEPAADADEQPAADPPVPAGDGFTFLDAGGAEVDEDEPQWPVADDAPAADDKGLDDFFKGLS
jgi:predicted component of type VI protein secretion system